MDWFLLTSPWTGFYMIVTSVMKELKVTVIAQERQEVTNSPFRIVQDSYDLFTTERELSFDKNKIPRFLVQDSLTFPLRLRDHSSIF